MNMDRAWTISVGDELLTGESLDTHGRTIARRLGDLGSRVLEHVVVGDDRVALAKTIRARRAMGGLLIVTGGLGPTLDDITREAFADGLGVPLEEDPRGIAHLDTWFRAKGRAMSPGNRRQALRPAGSRLIENPRGTAPGFLGGDGTFAYLALPGPPREMEPMLDEALRELFPAASPRPTRLIRAFGLGESDAAHRIESLIERSGRLPVATTVSDSIVTARVRGISAADEQEVERLAAEVRRAWAPYAFDDGHQGLAEVVGVRCRDLGLRISTAESCTGGLVGGALTEVSGSSDWYVGGVVAYENRRKHEDLGVSLSSIETEGAVSRAVVEAMATGVADRCGAEIGVATTGVAGPGGGRDDKPVGTVWIGIADERGVASRCFGFNGDRRLVRRRTVLAALQLLRFRLDRIDAPLLWEVTS